MRFSKPPTASEWALAVYFLAALIMGFGVMGLAAAYRAAPEMAETARALEHRALWTFGLGGAVAIVCWIFRRWTD